MGNDNDIIRRGDKMDLEAIRKKHGKSQFQMCNLIGTSINSYVRWEHGVVTPNEENQAKIDKAIKLLEG